MARWRFTSASSAPHLPDLLADEAAVGLELALAGAAGPDPAAGTRQVGPHPGQAREVILERRQLDLEPPSRVFGVAGEDVDDQRRAIEDLAVEQLLEAALLVGAELVVDDEQVEVGGRLLVDQLGGATLARSTRPGPGALGAGRAEPTTVAPAVSARAASSASERPTGHRPSVALSRPIRKARSTGVVRSIRRARSDIGSRFMVADRACAAPLPTWPVPQVLLRGPLPLLPYLPYTAYAGGPTEATWSSRPRPGSTRALSTISADASDAHVPSPSPWWPSAWHVAGRSRIGELDQLPPSRPRGASALVGATLAHAADDLAAGGQARPTSRSATRPPLADALRDPLTGLGNHRAFQEELDRQVEPAPALWRARSRCCSSTSTSSSRSTTSTGHAGGDRALADFGRLLELAICAAPIVPSGSAATSSPILLPHTDAEGARIVARRLLASALAPPLRLDDLTPISFSAGVSSMPELADSRAQLYSQADSALYARQARRAHRGRRVRSAGRPAIRRRLRRPRPRSPRSSRGASCARSTSRSSRSTGGQVLGLRGADPARAARAVRRPRWRCSPRRQPAATSSALDLACIETTLVGRAGPARATSS